MNIEVGKTYKLLGGTKAVVTGRLPEPTDDDRKFVGYHITDSGYARPVSWDTTGLSSSASTRAFDIVEVWVDPPRVDWSKMPEWANFVARDENGKWFWYNAKPRPTGNSLCAGKWLTCDGKGVYEGGWGPIPNAFEPAFTGDWQLSLIKR